MRKIFIMLTLFWVPLFQAMAAPNVVVTIQPLHSLAAYLMDGVGEPYLLLPPDSSPHDFQLKPSDAAQIYEADLVIWVGPELETFLEKPLKSLSNPSHFLTLADIEGLDLLPYQSYHTHGEEHAHHDSHDHAHEHAQEHDHIDPHFWLDPMRVKTIAKAIAMRLKSEDEKHAAVYDKNLKSLLIQLDALEKELTKSLKSVKKVSFMVFHDGYQYFTTHFQLASHGPLIDNPHAPFSLKRIQDIKKRIQEENIQCVFGEPDTNQNFLNQLVESTKARTGFLDPLGYHLKPGKEAYFEMMHQLRDNLVECLKGKGT